MEQDTSPTSDGMLVQSAARNVPFLFSGDGREYFRIWIVNLVLSVLTLGIYSAWAKVRRLQYMYRHVRVSDGGFNYHGAPLAILRGRLIAVGFILLIGAMEFLGTLGEVAVLLFMAVTIPILLQRALRFRLHNSSYRGIRFAFSGSTGGAYLVYLMLPLLASLGGVAEPLRQYHLRRYQRNNTMLGETPFRLVSSARDFYDVYRNIALAWIGILFGYWIILLIRSGIASPSLPHSGSGAPRAVVVLAAIGIAAFFVFSRSYIVARIQNHVWNGTWLGSSKFISTVSVRRLWIIDLTNFAAIGLTFGLFMPYATMRALKYRIECVSLVLAGDIESLVASHGGAESSVGSETSELLGYDIEL